MIGAGKYIPEKVVTSAELEEQMGFERLGVRKGTIKLLNGVNERHFASDEENTSDLAAKAGMQAIEMAGIDPEDIDLLIFASISPGFYRNRLLPMLSSINWELPTQSALM